MREISEKQQRPVETEIALYLDGKKINLHFKNEVQEFVVQLDRAQAEGLADAMLSLMVKK